jgi:hypothetical protein
VKVTEAVSETLWYERTLVVVSVQNVAQKELVVRVTLETFTPSSSDAVLQTVT